MTELADGKQNNFWRFVQKPLVIFSGMIIFWIVFFLVAVGILDDLWFTTSPSMTLEQLNYFGGGFNVLTSLFTGLTFAGLVISIILQRKELADTREQFEGQKEALQNQEFDNKFFQMLNLLNKNTERLKIELNIFNKATLSFDKKKFSGVDVFEGLKEMLLQELEVSDSEDVTNNSANTPKLDLFKNSFIEFNNSYDTTFKYFYLNLFQILAYIDDRNKEDKEAVKKYTNIVRAQLTKDQLVLLAFNGIGMVNLGSDNSSDKYKNLIEKYAFLEHLSYEDLCSGDVPTLCKIVLRSYKEQAYGNNNSLYRAIATD